MKYSRTTQNYQQHKHRIEGKCLGTNSAENKLGMSQLCHAIGEKVKKKEKRKKCLQYIYRNTTCEVYKIIFVTYRYSQNWEGISWSLVLGMAI